MAATAKLETEVDIAHEPTKISTGPNPNFPEAPEELIVEDFPDSSKTPDMIGPMIAATPLTSANAPIAIGACSGFGLAESEAAAKPTDEKPPA